MSTSPTSIADSEDTLPINHDPQPPIIIRAKTTTRTYGKSTIVPIIPTVVQSEDSNNGDIEMTSYEMKEVGGKEGNSLKQQDSLIIPETDFDLPTTVEKVIDRRSRQDRIDEGEEVEDILDEGLIRTSGGYSLNVNGSTSSITSSSPSKHINNQSHSTDPTSEEEDELDEEEEEEEEISKRSRVITTSSPCATAERRGTLLDASSSDNEEDDVDMDTTIMLGKKSAQQELDELNAQYAEEDRLAELEEQLAKSRKTSIPSITTTTTTSDVVASSSIIIDIMATLPPAFPLAQNLAGSSSLTSLTTSIPSSSTTLNRQNDHPSLPATSEDPSIIETESSPPPTSKPFNKKRNVILDSDDDDNEEEIEEVIKKPSTFRRVQSSDEDDSEDETVVKTIASATTSTLPPKSKRERMEELARKRAPPPVVKPLEEVVIERSRSVSYSGGDSDDQSRGRKGKSIDKTVKKRKGVFSKKEELATNMETAALLRQQDARIESHTRSYLNPAEIAAKRAPAPKARLSLKPLFAYSAPNPVPSIASTSNHVTNLPSSEIESADSPNGISSSHLPQSTASPLIFSTPRPIIRRIERPKPPMKLDVEEDDDDDEDLPTLEENDARRAMEKEKKLRKDALDNKKLLALAAAASLQDDSDDSDIEIIAPPPPPTSSSTIFGKKGHSDPKSIEEALSTPRLTADQRKIRSLAGNKATHVEDDATETQLVASAHTFGKKLGEDIRAAPRSLKRDSMGGLVSNNKLVGMKKKIIAPTGEQLNQSIKMKIKMQNAKIVQYKETQFRRKQNEQREEEVAKEVEKFNPRTLIDKVGARKGELASQRITEEEEEDAMDEDYDGSQGDDEEEDDEMGSGSDNEVPAGIDAEAMESGSEEEEEEEVKKVISSGEEEEEESVPLPISKRRKLQIDDEDEEEDKVVEEEEAVSMPSKVVLPAGISGGFSQFFDDDFSQDIRQGADVDGYRSIGNAKAKLADIGEELLNIDERDEDIALLESRNAFKYDTLATPQVVAPPQQYINKNGLLTQNRPANLYDYEDSSPYHISTILDSESQGLTQTQVDNTQTPSRNSLSIGKPLRSVNSYGFDLSAAKTGSLEEPEPTELAATEIAEVREEEEEEEETQDGFGFPSAQAPRPLASVFLPQVPAIAAIKKRVESAFVDDSADLSDEETGMGAGSADEDERGMDVDDEDLVDNDAVDAELASEQDARADNLRRLQEEADEIENLKHAEGVAAGKARAKGKGLGDFEDDDFDDDNYGMATKHRAKPRADNSTLAALRTNEETQSFANAMNLDVDLPDHEIENLLTSPPREAFIEKRYKKSSNKESRGSRRVGESDDQEDESDDASSEVEEEQEEINSSDDEEGFGRSIGLLEYASRNVELAYNGHSSSPQKKIIINKPKAKNLRVPTKAGEFDESAYRSHFTGNKPYKSISKDESQDTNGVTAGAKSSVTSFIGQKAKAKATYGGVLEAGLHGKTNTVAKSSLKFRKNNFATG